MTWSHMSQPQAKFPNSSTQSSIERTYPHSQSYLIIYQTKQLDSKYKPKVNSSYSSKVNCFAWVLFSVDLLLFEGFYGSGIYSGCQVRNGLLRGFGLLYGCFLMSRIGWRLLWRRCSGDHSYTCSISASSNSTKTTTNSTKDLHLILPP